MPRPNNVQNLGYQKIKVENFGPIAKGEVELRPLTVFTGPSNTGKSWLATLVYALQYQQQKFNQRYYWEDIFWDNGIKERLGKRKLKFPENPKTWIGGIESNEKIKLTDSERKIVKFFLEGESDLFEREILRCFGLSNHEHLVREAYDGKAVVEFSLKRNWIFEDFVATFVFGKDVVEYSVEPPFYIEFKNINEKLLNELKHVLKRIDRSRSSDQEYNLEDLAFLAEVILHLIHIQLTQSQSAWYLPADRGGIMHAHHAVVSALIQNASRAGLYKQSSIPVLSGILSDFLENLINLSQDNNRHSSRKASVNHANSLEENILGGPVNIEQTDVNYPRFSWRPVGWTRSLPLLSASSMVSELVPIALYLKSLVNTGDLLILEEPEAHLHPSKQVDLVNEVATWVKAGIYVVITTHSEWVLEQLSNLVGSSKSGENMELSTDKVGLWQFQSKNGDGSEIQEVQWREDEGGYNTGFEAVAEDLHNKWSRIVGGS